MRTQRMNVQDIKAVMDNIKRKYNPDADTMKLVEEDLCDGMSQEDIYKYCNKNISIMRKRIISECIRRGYSEKEIQKIISSGIKEKNLEVIYQLVEKDVDIYVISDMAPDYERLMEYCAKLENKIEEAKAVQSMEHLNSDDSDNSINSDIEDDNASDVKNNFCGNAKEDNSNSIQEDKKVKSSTFADNKQENNDKEKMNNAADEKKVSDKAEYNQKAISKDSKKKCEDEDRDNKESETSLNIRNAASGSGISSDDLNSFLEGLKGVMVDSSAISIEKIKAQLREEYSDMIKELEEKIDIRDRFIASQFKRINILYKYEEKAKNLEKELNTANDSLNYYKVMFEAEEAIRKSKELSESIRDTSLNETATIKDSMVINDSAVINNCKVLNDESKGVLSSGDKTSNIPEKKINDNSNRVSIEDIPVECHDNIIQFSDYSGRLHSTCVEYTSKKNSGIGKAIAAFAFKKRSRRSLMQLVIAGELSAEQLTHIVTAVRSGLTEEQLCSLIESKVPAEKMPQIIEIAMLENKMGYTA